VKILIASTHIPFIRGGGTMIVEDLQAELSLRGHDVDTLNIPFWSSWDEMMDQMLALRLINVAHVADRLICIRTPSYLLHHPNKVVWFIHHHRGAYDLWGTPFQDIPNTSEGMKVLASIHESDNKSLRQAKKLFTNSQQVSSRLKRYNELESEVLYPPLRHPERFQCRSYGDYIFYPSRIANVKRQKLAIESMQHVTSDVKLIIAGSPDDAKELQELQALIESLQLQNKVDLQGRWISDEEKVELFSNALSGMYIPYDEDSYGYPTLESFQARKPVITCSDSGGTLEIIEDGVNGLVCEPDPKSLALAIDRMSQDKSQARAMGTRGLERLESMKISWDFVSQQLTA
jgi:glycosyltransferase involved in cell wall biosynthesis